MNVINTNMFGLNCKFFARVSLLAIWPWNLVWEAEFDVLLHAFLEGGVFLGCSHAHQHLQEGYCVSFNPL